MPPAPGPPTSTSRASPTESQAPSQAQPGAEPQEVAQLDLAATPELLQQILASSALDQKHRTMFVKRVVEAYPQLEVQHQQFLSLVATRLSSQQDASSIKNEILKYMMVHSGVSTWCVPLKKLVESVGQ